MRARVTREHRLQAEQLVDGPPVPAAAFVASVARALADAEEAGRERGVRPFRELFSGGPDTVCRTTHRESAAAPECSAASIDCVEVPLDDLRDAFSEAGEESDEDRVLGLLADPDGVGTEERARALLGHLAYYGFAVVRREQS